jgi:hypothetical protein
MHGAGIYRGRYGRDPGLGLSRAAVVQQDIDAFVDEQEGGLAGRLRETGASDEDRWRDYELLQLYDRFSLHFCMRDTASETSELQGYRLEPGGAEWRVRIEPFPFAESPARFSLVRRVLPKRAWTNGEFRREFFAQEPERVEVELI